MNPLRYVNLYCNTACDSRCTTCSFWKMRPKHLLTPRMLDSVAASRYVGTETWFALQGGEFTLHPDAGAILDLFADLNYILFTNMLNSGRVIDLMNRHGIRYITVSLDGGPEGYARIRGVDGFDRVTDGILRAAEKASVSVGITITPWSTYDDIRRAMDWCDRAGIAYGLNVYTESRIYESTRPAGPIPFLQQLADEAHDSFCAAHVRWSRGELSLPCHSIRRVASISPEGDVRLCHNRDVILGNIGEQTFDAIWGSRQTAAIHTQYESCNACWTSCYREHDLAEAQ